MRPLRRPRIAGKLRTDSLIFSVNLSIKEPGLMIKQLANRASMICLNDSLNDASMVPSMIAHHEML